MTRGYRLPAKAVVHTVGPRIPEDTDPSENDRALLSDCYMNSLKVAADNGHHSIVFPAIATGAHGFPIADAAAIACKAVDEFLQEPNNRARIQLVVFCVLADAMGIYEHIMRLYFPTGSHLLSNTAAAESARPSDGGPSDDDSSDDNESPAEPTVSAAEHQG